MPSIEFIIKYNLINENSLIICEYETEKIESEKFNLNIYKEKKYGSKKIVILKK